MTIVIAEPAEVPETFNVLLYGPPGAGKTAGAATAPGPLMWVNLEGGGALSYARKVAGERGTELHEVRVNRDEPQLSQILRGVYAHVRDGAEPVVRTVVVDTIGKVRDHLAREFGADQPSRDSMQKWKVVATTMDGFVQGLRDLDVNVVLIAHEDISDDPAGSGRVIRPKIGGHTEKVCAEADIIAYCGRAPDGTYAGVLAQVNERRAKDRSGGLGSSRELDLAEWLGAYREALAPDAPRAAPSADPVPLAEPAAS
jgi:hypothetical protein